MKKQKQQNNIPRQITKLRNKIKGCALEAKRQAVRFLDFYQEQVKKNEYLKLMRLEKPYGYLLTMLPTWWVVAFCAQSVFVAIWYMLIFFVGAVLVRSAGCVINDIADCEIDKKVKRTKSRPIASGKIKKTDAAKLAALLLLASSVLLLFLPKKSIIIAAFAIIPICIYPLTKRVTNYPQIFLGITFNLGVLIAWFAMQEHASAPEYSAAKPNAIGVAIYFAAIFWTIGYDVIYGHQDKKDDIEIGVKSMALTLGDKTNEAVRLLYKMTSFLLFIVGFTFSMNLLFYPIMAFAAYMLYWQSKDLDIDDRANCSKNFRYNVKCGFLIFFAILVGRI